MGRRSSSRTDDSGGIRSGMERDLALSQKTLASIGSLVVAASYLEWCLARVVLWLTEESPARVNDVGRDLLGRLLERAQEAAAQEAAATDSGRGTDVLDIFRGHDLEAYRETRNHVVHGRIRGIDEVHFKAVRHQRSGAPSFVIGRVDGIGEVTSGMLRLTSELESLLPEEYEQRDLTVDGTGASAVTISFISIGAKGIAGSA